MKIFVCANWGEKFVGLLINKWKEQGHEVEYQLGYNPQLHQESDLCFVDACDNNAVVASRHRFDGSRLAIRAIDIECWGPARQPNGVTWENVDYLVFGARHIWDLVDSYIPFEDYPDLKIEHIPFGVDLSQWTYAQRWHGYNIACVCHRWSAKGIPLALQLLAKLPRRFTLHFLGTPSNEEWLHKYIDHFIASQGLNVTFNNGRVDDLDSWLEDKNYMLVASQKESFSYVAAEAAAKGIKPIIHNFWGAKDIWPAGLLWDTIDDAMHRLLWEQYDSVTYRAYVKENYDLDKTTARLNEFLEFPP